MKKLLVLLSIVLIAACSEPVYVPGPPGEPGPTGAPGPTGKPGPTGLPGTGFRLIAEYFDTVTEAVPFITINVPAILKKQSTTFVEGYWTTTSFPTIYTKMADGWIDNIDVCRILSVSWMYGKVYLHGMRVDDIYYIKVFEHN